MSLSYGSPRPANRRREIQPLTPFSLLVEAATGPSQRPSSRKDKRLGVGGVYLLVGLLGFVLLFMRVASRTYATQVVRAANGKINELAIVLPIHSPHVSEPVTRYPANAPVWMVTASKMKAKVAVQTASPK